MSDTDTSLIELDTIARKLLVGFLAIWRIWLQVTPGKTPWKMGVDGAAPLISRHRP